MTDTPYTPPSADLAVEEEILETTFSSLNIWRKIYLVFIWLTTVLVIAAFGLTITDYQPDTILIGTILAALYLGFTYWTHWAVVNRKVGHITAIAILNLIPGTNLIGCLIMLSIRRVTVNEHKKFKIESA